jgi:hypothetical protein
VEALHQPLEELGLPAHLVESAGRVRSPPQLRSQLSGVRGPARLGCRPPAALCRVRQSPWEVGGHYVRRRAMSPTYGRVTIILARTVSSGCVWRPHGVQRSRSGGGAGGGEWRLSCGPGSSC